MTRQTLPGTAPGTTQCSSTEEEATFRGFRYAVRTTRRHSGDQDGTPTLILGGSSQDRYSWARHEAALTALGPVVTVDLPGYGEADFLPASYGIDFLADAVQHLLEARRLARVNLVGACFGGAIALRFAQRHAHSLTRLVLVGMTKSIPPAYAGQAARWLRMSDQGRTAEIAAELVAQFMSPAGAGPVRRHAAVSRLLHRQFTQRTSAQERMDLEHTRRLLAHDWYVPLPAPRVPALVLTGEHDSLTTPGMGRQVAGCLEGAWFTTIKEADHLVPVERSDELSDVLTRFLADRTIEALPYCNQVEFIPPARLAP
ncbi:alpha/beta fold hydrolase [Actinacidiphila rubida]|uniref:Pimeloyl-ACP methyl ester carboxylesterase n=1 Tax=Actinacidiphila rubida TaxID=310780 RepID=A0A1H8NZR3_9ACTN|nr:alpha/beta hydrolase [Actinacidiphila rubida]SEO35097.1 Pimeloyl-ACP methyl ester carboxylesterase [Actinacidiphila rubida]